MPSREEPDVRNRAASPAQATGPSPLAYSEHSRDAIIDVVGPETIVRCFVATVIMALGLIAAVLGFRAAVAEAGWSRFFSIFASVESLWISVAITRYFSRWQTAPAAGELDASAPNSEQWAETPNGWLHKTTVTLLAVFGFMLAGGMLYPLFVVMVGPPDMAGEIEWVFTPLGSIVTGLLLGLLFGLHGGLLVALMLIDEEHERTQPGRSEGLHWLQ